MLYIILFGLLFLFACSNERVNDLLFKISFLSILFLTCFRSPSLGIDTAGGYYYYFQYIQNGINLSWVEPFWIFLNKLAIWTGLEYQGVLIFSGIISLVPIYYIISKTCVNKSFAFAIYYGLYFILYSFNLVRQNIAISIALLSILMYLKQKYFIAFLCFIAGFMFHHSILVVLIFLLVKKINLSFGKFVALLVCSYALGIILSNQFFFFIAGGYAKNLLLHDSYSGFRSSIMKPAIFTLAFNMFFLTIVFSQFEKIKKNSWFLMVLIGIIVMNLTMRLGQGSRVVLYFSIAQAIFIPNYIRNIDEKNDKFIISLLYVGFLGINFIRILIDQWDTVCPYTFFWL